MEEGKIYINLRDGGSGSFVEFGARMNPRRGKSCVASHCSSSITAATLARENTFLDIYFYLH